MRRAMLMPFLIFMAGLSPADNQSSAGEPSERSEGATRFVLVPETDGHWKRVEYYVERIPHSDYRQASEEAREAFRDLKYGIRIHWGVYALRNLKASWDFVRGMTFEQKQAYQQLYKEFNPKDFSAEEWMQMFERNGLKMFAFTTKHHDGFSMYDTKLVYAISLKWPGERLVLKTVQPKPDGTIAMLGVEKPLEWSMTEDEGVTIEIPKHLQAEANRPCKQA